MVSRYWMLWITKYTALLLSNKKNCHDNFSLITRISSYVFYFFYLFIYFSEIWYLPLGCYITNCHRSLAYIGLAKIIVAQDGSGCLFFKMPVNLSQYRGTVGLFNSRSIAKRSKVNSFVTSNYRNNTYIACSIIFVNKFFLFLSLFSVLFFLKDNVSKNNRQFLVLILFSSTILLIQFVFFLVF